MGSFVRALSQGLRVDFGLSHIKAKLLQGQGEAGDSEQQQPPRALSHRAPQRGRGSRRAGERWRTAERPGTAAGRTAAAPPGSLSTPPRAQPKHCPTSSLRPPLLVNKDGTKRSLSQVRVHSLCSRAASCDRHTFKQTESFLSL